METRLKGRKNEVVIGRDRPTVMIGEPINPTGKKMLASALVADNPDVIKEEALQQVAVGAHVLGVNVGSATDLV
ncbi:MAG: hypothetical protein JXA42_09295 [Anaerolineales bacterium]|nr:hypothetical protein [Anaerolineales bacterium]